MNDHDPVALVMGGSRGLGLLLARDLLARGFTVVVTARDPEELANAAELLGAGDRLVTKVCDVGDAHAVGAVVGDVEAGVGPIEVLLNVAGIIQTGPAESMRLGDYVSAVDTMLWGPVHATLAVLPHLRRRGHGRIGTITSIGGKVSPPHLLPYATAKFGAVGFSEGLSASLSGTGITATTVVPGLMRTGSHGRAAFTGRRREEYRWFAVAASLPLLSIDAERAARRIVDGVLRGRPVVVLTPLAWLGIRVHGLAPATTVRVLGLTGRLLPGAPARGGAGAVEGRAVRPGSPSRLFEVLTTLGRRAERRNNEA